MGDGLTCLNADNNARQKAKDALSLEEDIEKMETELSAKYYQLGKSVYEMADYKAKEINDLVDRLVEAKIKLSNIKNLRVCLHCMAQNPKENAYCGKCGNILGRDNDE